MNRESFVGRRFHARSGNIATVTGHAFIDDQQMLSVTWETPASDQDIEDFQRSYLEIINQASDAGQSEDGNAYAT